jgi:CRISPR-associated protein Csb3
MSNPDPPIRINVDLTNPGQFFACCGLLELAGRLWNGAEGWFDDGGFRLRAAKDAKGGLASSVMDSFVNCCLTNTMTNEQFARLDELVEMKEKDRQQTPGLEDEKKALKKLRREEPIVLLDPFNLRIDWFLDDRAGGDRFKTWAGQQSVLQIAIAMKEATNALFLLTPPSEQWLTETRSGCGLPFNFDSDLGGQGAAIDVGFSFDPLSASAMTRIEPTVRPCLEMLAFVGLQRFRPRQMLNTNRFVYCLWHQPLPPEIAATAACGFLPSRENRSFEFRLLYRTEYLKSFLPAIPYQGEFHE